MGKGIWQRKELIVIANDLFQARSSYRFYMKSPPLSVIARRCFSDEAIPIVVVLKPGLLFLSSYGLVGDCFDAQIASRNDN